MQVAWKAWAFFKRDLIADLSYKLSFTLQALHILVGVAAYYFLAQILGDRPGGYAAFPFLVVGMAANGYMTTALVCFSQAIRGGQVSGTLEAVLTTRTAPSTFILLSSFYPFTRGTIDALVFLIGGSALGLSLRQANVPAAVLLFVVSLLAFASVGILSATITLVFKRGESALSFFVSLSWLLGGVFYPREVLPPLLQQFAEVLPIAHTVDALRATVIDGAGTAEILPQLGALGVFTVIALPLSLVAFNAGLRRARVTGTLSHL